MEPITVHFDEYDYQPFYPRPDFALYAKAQNVKRVGHLAKILAVVGLLLLLLPMLATKAAGVANSLTDRAARNIYELASEQVAAETTIKNTLPPLDPALPIEPRVIIPTIGVNAQIRQYPLERYEEALKLGAWMPTNFGVPGSDGPVIIAAHRFGYLKWSNQFRRENSFYNLPKLEVGDRVEVVWHQRKFVYEIYAKETGTEITDYEAGLILFTCNDLVSDMRIVVYAKQV